MFVSYVTTDKNDDGLIGGIADEEPDRLVLLDQPGHERRQFCKVQLIRVLIVAPFAGCAMEGHDADTNGVRQNLG
jgi:hypothetical protein